MEDKNKIMDISTQANVRASASAAAAASSRAVRATSCCSYDSFDTFLEMAFPYSNVACSLSRNPITVCFNISGCHLKGYS